MPAPTRSSKAEKPLIEARDNNNSNAPCKKVLFDSSKKKINAKEEIVTRLYYCGTVTSRSRSRGRAN